MTNSTTAVNSTVVQYVNKYQQQNWLIATSVDSICLVILTWMTLSLIIYGIQRGKWKDKTSNSLAAASAGRVYSVAVLAMLCGFLRIGSDLASFNVGYAPNTEATCRAALQASSVGYICTLCLVYMFLWLRQRALYQHPVLEDHYNKWLVAVSWISITVILMGLALTLVLYVAFNQFTSSVDGCQLKVQNGSTQWPAYMSTGITAFGQILMIFLFAYPLRIQSARRNAERMVRLLKRCGIMVMVCMITDAVASAYLSAPPSAHLPWMFYSVNMFVNLVAVYLSFETWPEICLTPFRCCLKVKRKEEPMSVSRTKSDI